MARSLLSSSSQEVHKANWAGSAGLRYHGLISGRDDDIAGIAVTFNDATNNYRFLNNADSSQTNVEATYRAQIKPWLALQLTVQYILNPNMDPTRQNAWVVGAITGIAF